MILNNSLRKRTHVMVAWIGDRDLNLYKDFINTNSPINSTRTLLPVVKPDLGPIINTLINSNEHTFDRAILLDSVRSRETAPITYKIKTEEYAKWATTFISTVNHRDIEIVLKACPLKDPTDFTKIYEYAEKIVIDLVEQGSQITVNFTPGTAHMSAVWIAISKRFNVKLIQISKQSGIRTIHVPFRLIGDIDFGQVSDKPEEALSNKQNEFDIVPFSDIIYSCNSMKRLIILAQKIARLLSYNRKEVNNSLAVHITGPTGSGKEGIAKGIHLASGRKGNFVAVNCSAIPKDLFESEMFGFVKGSFTGANFDKIGNFEQANGGTIFLDEIGDIPLEQQTKLLRVIQERKIRRTGAPEETIIDINVITATHKNLGRMVEENTFREDLFYRLTTVTLKIPSLKERGKEDIRLLLEYYLSKFNENFGATKTFSSDALEVLVEHDWPGNVRELQNTLIRAAIFSDEENEISKSMALDAILFSKSSYIKAMEKKENFDSKFMPIKPDSNGYVNLQSVLDEVEKAYIDYALSKTKYNRSKAAALLGLANYQTFNNRRKKIEVRQNQKQKDNCSNENR